MLAAGVIQTNHDGLKMIQAAGGGRGTKADGEGNEPVGGFECVELSSPKRPLQSGKHHAGTLQRAVSSVIQGGADIPK